MTIARRLQGAIEVSQQTKIIACNRQPERDRAKSGFKNSRLLKGREERGGREEISWREAFAGRATRIYDRCQVTACGLIRCW